MLENTRSFHLISDFAKIEPLLQSDTLRTTVKPLASISFRNLPNLSDGAPICKCETSTSKSTFRFNGLRILAFGTLFVKL